MNNRDNRGDIHEYTLMKMQVGSEIEDRRRRRWLCSLAGGILQSRVFYGNEEAEGEAKQKKNGWEKESSQTTERCLFRSTPPITESNRGKN